jgi:ribosome biogenesis protein NSA2
MFVSLASSPAGLRMTKAHVTHPELKATFSLDILGVKKNPNGAMYSSLGVITKGGLHSLVL